MAFADDVAANATGRSGLIFPNSSESITGVLNEIMPFVRQARSDRLTDYKDRALFNEEAPIRQEAARRAMNPFGRNPNDPITNIPTGIAPADPNINTRMGPETPVQEAIEPLNKLQQAQVGLQQADLKQRTAAEQERAAEANRQFGLNQLKNSQIYETKIADMQRKSDDAEGRLKVAQDRLSQNANDAASRNAYHQSQIDALKAKHDLDLAQKDKALDEQKRMNDARIKDLESRGKTTTTTTLQGDPNAPTGRTTVTERGDKGTNYPKTGRVRIRDKDGKVHVGDAGELEDALKVPGVTYLGPADANP